MTKSEKLGRPTLNVRSTNIRLTDGVAERIDAVAGKNRRAQFIRDAVERELRRIEDKAQPEASGKV